MTSWWLVLAGLAAADPYGHCRDEFANAPSRYDGWRCFYMAVRKGAPAAGAEAELLAAVEADPWAQVVLGHLYSDRGDDRAEVAYRTAMVRFAAEPAGRAQARFGLANFLWHRGRATEQVGEILAAADADAVASGDSMVVATARAQLARHLLRTATDYDRAYTLAREAEALAFPSGPYQLRLLVLHVLAGVCRDTARIEEELDFRQRMTELAVAEGDAYVEATSRINVAQNWLVHPGDAPPGAALAEAERALDAARRAGNGYSEAGAQCVVARALGPSHAEAAARWRACVEGYAAVGAPESAILGRSGLALATVRSDPAAAVALADQAVAEARRSGAAESEVEARVVAGVVRHLGGVAGADAALLAAVERLERTRDQQATEEERAGVAARWRLAYDVLAATRLESGDVGGAFAAVERLRGRQLLDWMEAGGTVPGGDEAAHQARVRAVEAASAALAAAERPGEAEAALLELERAEGAEARARWAEARRAWDGSLVEGERDVVPTIQSALADGEVFVSWQTPPEQGVVPLPTPPWAILVRRDGTEVVPLPPLSRPERRVEAFVGRILARADVLDVDNPLAVWSRPVEAALRPADRRVVAVLDGAQHGAPPALGRAVSLVPSGRVWALLRARALPEGAVGAVAVAGAGLPRAAAEARGVVSALGGRVVDPGTLEGLVAAGPARFRLLHVAAHARADAARPGRSAVEIGGGDDGRVQPREVVSLGLSGQVVVLSACSSTAGRLVGGEGVLGLARAFLQGGARVVVGSRWPVRDSEAAAWVRAFTTSLGEGAPVDEAVLQASRSLQRAGYPAAAHAAFVAVGDGGWAPFPEAPGGPSAWPLLGVLGLLGAAGLLVGRSRWRRGEPGVVR